MKTSSNFKQLAKDLRKGQTKEEYKLWQLLKTNKTGYKFKRQFVIHDKYIVDFICLEKKLIIELDGSQHVDNEQDKIRDKYLQSLEFMILRLWNNEVNKNIEGVYEKIVDTLNNN
jgi:very-short-patch-repair endonuclease